MKNVIISAAIFMLVCCGEAEATSKKKVTNRVVKPITKVEDSNMFKYTHVDPVEINLDDMPFSEAFRIEHHAKGEGHTFWWRNVEYTTDLADIDEFVLKHMNSERPLIGWVTNNDDPDDDCKSNKLDDCGICDGPGKITWFRDKDGDGLGTFTEWITSCTYPEEVEIKKFHYDKEVKVQFESLLEGGGDQGVTK